MECCLNFFMNFLNIEKSFVFFQYFKFSSRFMLFPTLKKNCVKKKSGGGGGGYIFFFFFNISNLMIKFPISTIWRNHLPFNQ